jgi:hypothetical protein
MYKIIGADQKEYGPISGAQLREWIRDGRANAQTRARLESGGEWQPLSAFEEFADVFHPGTATPYPASAPTPTPLSTGDSREAALKAVKGPAIALIVTASLGVVLYLIAGFARLFGHPMDPEMLSRFPPEMRSWIQQSQQGSLNGLLNLAVAAINGFVLLGAIKMLRLQSYGLCFAACIVAMLPCMNCCCILGLPFGIWGLIVLNKTEVKSQF